METNTPQPINNTSTQPVDLLSAQQPQAPAQTPSVPKGKGFMGMLIVLLVMVILLLGGFFVYRNFMANQVAQAPKTDTSSQDSEAIRALDQQVQGVDTGDIDVEMQQIDQQLQDL